MTMDIRAFIIECLDHDARDNAFVADSWQREHPPGKFEFPISMHLNRYGPDSVSRGLASARDVVNRHRPAAQDRLQQYLDEQRPCVGCGEYDTGDGGTEFQVADINDCPELRALAWRWSHHPKWNKRWCLHVGTKNIDTTSRDDRARNIRSYIEVCRRCGEQIGEAHEERLITVKGTR